MTEQFHRFAVLLEGAFSDEFVNHFSIRSEPEQYDRVHSPQHRRLEIEYSGRGRHAERLLESPLFAESEEQANHDADQHNTDDTYSRGAPSSLRSQQTEGIIDNHHRKAADYGGTEGGETPVSGQQKRHRRTRHRSEQNEPECSYPQE